MQVKEAARNRQSTARKAANKRQSARTKREGEQATEREDKARRRTRRGVRAAAFLVCGERSLLSWCVASGAFLCGARKESAAIRRRRESDEGVVQSRSSEKERKCDLEKGAVQMEKPPLHELFERAQGDR